MMRWLVFVASGLTLTILYTTRVACAQSAPTAAGASADSWCNSKPEAPFCHAVRGVRWAAGEMLRTRP
jgi:hypothetical protein